MKDLRSAFGDLIREPAVIDELDMQIVEMLRTDARLSARAIAKRLGRSPGGVLERIARLEREQVILGYFAQIDPARLGVGMLAIVGVLAGHDYSVPEIVRQLMEIPECERVYVVTGEWNLLVHMRVRDHHHLARVLFERLWNRPDFRHSTTMITLHQRGVPPGRLWKSFEASRQKPAQPSSRGGVAKKTRATSDASGSSEKAASRPPRAKARTRRAR